MTFPVPYGRLGLPGAPTPRSSLVLGFAQCRTPQAGLPQACVAMSVVMWSGVFYCFGGQVGWEAWWRGARGEGGGEGQERKKGLGGGGALELSCAGGLRRPAGRLLLLWWTALGGDAAFLQGRFDLSVSSVRIPF